MLQWAAVKFHPKIATVAMGHATATLSRNPEQRKASNATATG
jgi:hypothetical protein